MSDASPVDECVLLTRSAYAAHADLREMLRDSGRRVTVLADAHEAFAYLCTRQRGRRGHVALPSAGLMLVVDELDALTSGLLQSALQRYLPGTSMWRWDGGALIPMIEGRTADEVLEADPPRIETASGMEDDPVAGRAPVSGDELEMLLGAGDSGLPDGPDDPDRPRGMVDGENEGSGTNEPEGQLGRTDDGGSSSS